MVAIIYTPTYTEHTPSCRATATSNLRDRERVSGYTLKVYPYQ
jgi:hypothetical protein